MIIQDNFDREDSDSLGANWTETGVVGIQNNKACFLEGGEIIYNTPLTTTRNRDMSFDVFGVAASPTEDRFFVAYLAYQDDDNNIRLRIDSNSGGECTLFQNYDGDQTVLGTFTQDICGFPQTFLIRQLGNQLRVFTKLAGGEDKTYVLKLEVTLPNPDPTTPVQKFYLVTDSPTTFEFDNFFAQTTDRGTVKGKMDYDLCRPRDRY